MEPPVVDDSLSEFSLLYLPQAIAVNNYRGDIDSHAPQRGYTSYATRWLSLIRVRRFIERPTYTLE